MAKKAKAFDLVEGLFERQETGSAQASILPAQRTNDEHPSSPAPSSSVRTGLGTTQGRKGQKLQRINMAFGTENHDYIRYESRRRGMSITEFVNFVLAEYRDGPDGHIG